MTKRTTLTGSVSTATLSAEKEQPSSSQHIGDPTMSEQEQQQSSMSECGDDIAAATAATAVDPRYSKYLRLLKMGVRQQQFAAELAADGLEMETLLLAAMMMASTK